MVSEGPFTIVFSQNIIYKYISFIILTLSIFLSGSVHKEKKAKINKQYKLK